MKKICVIFFLLISTTANSQVVGLQGKRFIPELEIHLNPNTVNTQKARYIGLNTQLGVKAGYILGRKSGISGGVRFFGVQKVGHSWDANQIYAFEEEEIKIRGIHWQLEYKIYRHSIAPLGYYYMIGYGGTSYKTKEYLFNGNPTTSRGADRTISMGYGRGLAFDRILVDLSVILNVPLNLIHGNTISNTTGVWFNNEEQIAERVLRRELIGLRISVGFGTL